VYLSFFIANTCQSLHRRQNSQEPNSRRQSGGAKKYPTSLNRPRFRSTCSHLTMVSMSISCSLGASANVAKVSEQNTKKR